MNQPGNQADQLASQRADSGQHPEFICLACGYDLTGLAPGCNCPECDAKSMPPTGPEGSLGTHIICPTCGYNLGGLKLESVCPECNAPCKDAVVKHSLYQSGGRYVSTLASGASLVLLSAYLFVGGILAMVIAVFGAGWLGSISGGIGPAAGWLLGMLVYLVMILGASIVWLIGWIRVTTQDPKLKHTAPSNGSRGLTRGMAITVFTLLIIQIVPIIGSLAALANMVCMAIFFFASCSYLRALGRRIPDYKLVRTVGMVRVVVIILLPILLVSIVTIAVSAASALSTAPGGISAGMGALAMLLMFISGLGLIWAYLRLVGQFAKSMKAVRDRARSMPSSFTPNAPTRSPAESPY